MFKDKKWHLKEDGAVPDEKYLKKLDAYAAYTGAVKERDNAYKDLYNREEFSYDVNKDAMYDKLVQDYAENASKAAEDAMGRAVSLTGGYGNSYAQQVSQQTFQDYMGGLDAESDKLYDRALDRYLLQGDQLEQKYALASDNLDKRYAEYVATMDQTGYIDNDADAEENGVFVSPDEMIGYIEELRGFETKDDVAAYLDDLEASGIISADKVDELMMEYADSLPYAEERAENRVQNYEFVDDGGANWGGIDRNAKVKYTFQDGRTETITLGKLFRKLINEGMSRKEARQEIYKLQHKLDISSKGKEKAE